MKSLLLAVPCALLVSTAQASTPQVAAGASLGLMGVGADVFLKFNNKINGRLSGNFGSIDADGEEDGIDYKGELDLSSFGALFDFHPWGGGFRITGGVYSNSNQLDLEASGTEPADIGDRTYAIDAAKLNSKVDFDSTAPYLGVGWGNPMKSGSRWAFMVDAGVLFQGSPAAEMTASGTVTDVGTGQTFDVNDTSNPAAAEFQTQLANEEENLNEDLEDFDMMPVFTVGLSYRF